uniref:Vesicle transport v-SNARE N-terminal domain-containing protein n=1 Tax=Aplanochytrium stocchinoi TaxID=215587 RepID=A0A7S3PPH0_9STRA|mmetsp:Transcript_17190/g.21173  ORF Transcript_17190/g.21173 Transcript_17190/m.21173 type:complete len:164 (-) Transcript_17190:240-731(-)|eukprot:CAMPEP_0204834276 /NCGR_PEP_ID=MMETSP1346-20131115/19375_1 /ASSEMBLY_ACC=CAM_ASM_000771 /TAXON_ID=215587 /ORGANISM="Aplanochytrium stocchinoi, Strain GSBS06" /LENGTH=163 /DNA_ID=CAMNT_0051967491 /DNA_START=183 /DNA_END=674 /DNA_ORIENTATION=+
MIEVYKEQVDKLCKELDALLSADGAEKAPEKIKELERLLKIVKVEARSSVEVKNKYKNWILEKEQQFEEYRRNVLLNTKGMSEGTANVRNRFIDVNERMSNSTKQLLEARRTIQDTETVGLQIQSDMAQQREILQRNQERAEEIHSNLGLADKLVTSLSKWWR